MHRRLVALTVLASACFVIPFAGGDSTPPARMVSNGKRVPCDLGVVNGFVENLGQWHEDVALAASANGEWLHVRADGLRFGRGTAAFGLTPTNGRAGAPEGLTPTGAVCNFLLGADPAQHHTGATVFQAAALPAIADGVSLIARRAAPGRVASFAYDLLLAADADLDSVELRVLGATELSIDETNGELVMRGPGGELRQSEPVAWSESHGQRQPVDCRFELRGHDRYGFVVTGTATPVALCVDPDLQWRTNFGGSLRDDGKGIGTAQNGDVLVGGTTLSPALPTTFTTFDPSYNGTWPTPRDIGDCFVARLAASDGSLLWCTYVGGGENDYLDELHCIGDECVLAGWTSSTDYPTTPGAYDRSHNGTGDGYLYLGGDVMVTRLAADGRSLVWSTLLGGSQLEYPLAMAIAPNGDVAVTGHVHSPDFPTTSGAFSDTKLGHSDFFVTVIKDDGSSLVASTYCGGTRGEEYTYGLAFAANGDVIAAGGTNSDDLPVTPGVLGPTYGGGTEHTADAFVIRFDAMLTAVQWCTYLGTPSNESQRGMALHDDGSITVSGFIDGPGLPTSPGVIAPTHQGLRDGFLWRISGDGATSHWATYFGGALADQVERVIPLGGGRLAVVGKTQSTTLPYTPGSVGPAPMGFDDALLAIVAGDGGSIDYATALGGVYSERCMAVAQNPDGDLVVTGTAYGNSVAPTAGGRSYSGGGDAYIYRLAALPNGAVRFGSPSGTCNRDARIRTRSAPVVGDGQFALTCGTVPVGSPTLAAVSFAGLTTPIALPGADLWVDPNVMLASIGLPVDSWSTATLPLPLPNDPGFAGLPLFAQFLWLDACPATALGASDAIAITIQP
ncbi:MAG: hypothetical protein NXI31_19235 [bacterium]|nr:hypothetical protein [bacterium]